ncbi:MAG TPA: flagella accessory protein C [Methanomassiliicoccales archaeon]|nr:flagella accessory protein C [Methanomassiliicoccales archaeon]
MMRMNTSPFLLFLGIGVLNPFGKKSGGGKGSEDEIDDIVVGPMPQAQNNAGAPGVDSKKVEEMEGSLNDVKDKLRTVETSSKSVKNELEGLRGDLKKTNETIKQLLSVYEVVSQEYNPFVDAPAKKAQVQSVNPSTISYSGLASDGWSKQQASVPAKTVVPGPYDKVIGPDGDAIEVKEVKVEQRPSEVAGANRGGDKMAMSSEKESALRADKMLQDNYYIMQLLKLVEFQLEKIYLAKVNRVPVDAEDLQNLDKWLAEFKRVGLR